MPNNVRQSYKRQIERAEGNLDSALQHLAAVVEFYKENHPEISEPIEMVGLMLIEGQKVLGAVRESI